VQRFPRLGKTAKRIKSTKLTKKIPKVCFVPIAGQLRNHNIFSQQAMNFLTDEVWNNSPQHFTPKNLRPKEEATAANLEHLAMPMIHPTTGETISSYKK
jgi:peptidase E